MVFCLDIRDVSRKSLFMLIADRLTSLKGRVFITGLSAVDPLRLRMKIDPAFKQAPPYKENKRLYDFLREKTSKSMFLKRLGQFLIACPFVPEEAQEKGREASFDSKKASLITDDLPLLYNGFAMFDLFGRYEGFVQDLIGLLFHEDTDERKFFFTAADFFFHGCDFETLNEELEDAVNFEDSRMRDVATNKEELFQRLFLYQHELPSGHARQRILPRLFQQLLVNRRIVADPQVARKLLFIPKQSKEEGDLWNKQLGLFENIEKELRGESEENPVKPGLQKRLIDDFLGHYATAKQPGKDTSKILFEEKSLDPLQDKITFSAEFLALKGNSKLRAIFDSLYDSRKSRETNLLKLTQTLAFKNGELHQMIASVLGEKFPYSELIRKAVITAKEQSLDFNSKNFKQNVEAFFHSNLRSLSEFVFVLYSEDRINEKNKIIYRSAKKQLGLKSPGNLEEPLEQKDMSGFGHANPVRVRNDFVHKLIGVKEEWLLKSYKAFIENKVAGEIENYTFRRVDLLYRKYGERLFDYLYERFLFQSELMVGYHDFKEILIGIKFTSLNQLIKYGYNANYKQPVQWLKDPFYGSGKIPFETGGEPLQKILSHAIIKVKNAYFDYFHSLNLISKKTISSELEWIERVIADYNKSGKMNLFAEDFIKHLRHNPYLNDLWNWITQFLFDKIKHLPNNSNVSILLEERFSYLTFFGSERTVEIDYNNYSLVLINNASQKFPTLDKLSLEFNKALTRLEKNEPHDSEIYPLRRMYVAILNLQKSWTKMQQVSAFCLNCLICSTNAEYYGNSREVDLKSLVTENRDSMKMFVCGSSKMLDRVEFKLLYNQFNPLIASNAKTLPQLNESLVFFFNLEKEFKYYATLFNLINQGMSDLPHVLYAPRVIKIFRSNLKDLAIGLNRELIGIGQEEVENIEKLCFRLKNMYSQIISEEPNYPIKARFLTLVLNRMENGEKKSGSRKLRQFFQKNTGRRQPEKKRIPEPGNFHQQNRHRFQIQGRAFRQESVFLFSRIRPTRAVGKYGR